MMHKQSCQSVIMIKPKVFGYNEETAENNYYQKKTNEKSETISQKALKEFDDFAAKLEAYGVDVNVFNHSDPKAVDALFPNNWMSFPGDRRFCLYPMYAKSRRIERHPSVIASIKSTFGIKREIDYSSFEEQNAFCEGTGSIIFDHIFKVAYGCLSGRTDQDLTKKICNDLGYESVLFYANQTVSSKRLPIYHTNVIMSLGENFAVICLSAIDDLRQRKVIADKIAATKRQMILITEEQVQSFCGNILEVLNRRGEKIIVMSETAEKNFTVQQLDLLSKNASIVSSSLTTIETYGGGSARCMLCEVF